MRVLFLGCHARQYSTVESRRNLNRDATLTFKELRCFDDRGVAVTLDGLEVHPVLGDDLRLPTSGTDCDQNIQSEALRRAGWQAF